jgi:hypothetical protein
MQQKSRGGIGSLEFGGGRCRFMSLFLFDDRSLCSVLPLCSTARAGRCVYRGAAANSRPARGEKRRAGPPSRHR